MAEDILRIGLIGATPGGSWGARGHAPAYQAAAGVQLAAVCTAHPQTAAAAAEAFHATERYTDYHDLVQSPQVDIVSITTGIHTHYPMVKAALAAGKHVYCEWPLAASARDASELLRLAETTGVHHIVGLQSRFAPAVLYTRELLQEGYLGQPLTFHLHMLLSTALPPRPTARLNLARKEAGSNTLTNPGGHSLEVTCWLLGKIETLSAQVSTQVTEWTAAETAERVTVTAPDNVGIVARLKSGVVGTVQLSNTAVEGGGFRLEVYGTEGKLALTANGHLGNAWFRLFAARKGEPEEELSIPARFMSVTGLPLASPAYNVAQLFERFAAAIRTGQELAPSFADAVRVHEFLEAIDHSSTTRSWVTF